ncbi:hypothetical protein O181_012006 [Austropuccinia psidii MF-1]|uniref:Reverse transcriptase domain-containing protein n=1 Tax=Austropuccinia psidii MF-1 TaxID=1389203 RepID=A0A9Q3BTU0_9BASI|nr:hypothetical protein [Austropuccinia psidii MF-1]
MDLPPLSFLESLDEKWDYEEEPEEIETVLKVFCPDYKPYLDVFSKVKSEQLPPQCACDHHIGLEGLLPPKKDGGLCLCVAYCRLNAVTRNNRYPVTPMNHLLTIFNVSTIFFKVDLHSSFNLLRIKDWDQHLASFRTKYGSYEYLVMLFGLPNSPSSFHNLVNDIFSDLLDIFVVVYLDYIMVFSSTEEEHVKQVSAFLQRLRENNMFSKASKCVLHSSSGEYLVFFVSTDGLKMYSSNVQQVLNLPQPKNIKALQSFLVFSNFYHCFINNYSKNITYLTSLLKKHSPFIFNEGALSQFQSIKDAFTTASILSHSNPSL